MHYHMQFRRGSTSACAKYTGIAGELIVDMNLMRVRIYSGNGAENRLLDKGELASIYMENDKRFFVRTAENSYNGLRFVAYYPGRTLRLCRASSKAMSSYIGPEGELIFVEDEKSIYACDGRTPGGILL